MTVTFASEAVVLAAVINARFRGNSEFFFCRLLPLMCKPQNSASILHVKMPCGHFVIGFSQSCGKRSVLGMHEPDNSLDARKLLKHFGFDRVESWIWLLI